MKLTLQGICSLPFTLAIASLTCGVQAQTPDTLQPNVSQSAPAPSGAQAQSRSHNDSSSLVVVGLLAGGAALMAGGGHGGGSGSSSTAAAVQPQALQPQVLVTTVPQAAPVSSAAPVISTVKPATGDGTSPAVVVTLPGAAIVSPTAEVRPTPAPPTIATSTFSSVSNPTSSIATVADTSQSVVTSDSVGTAESVGTLDSTQYDKVTPTTPATVPEPSSLGALILGACGLAGLAFTARRRRVPA